MKIWVEPEAWKAIKRMPGHIRPRVRNAIQALSENPRPPHSKVLRVPDEMASPSLELRRLRLDNWRIVYVIDHEWNAVVVLAIRRRPPYDYSDLPDLLARL